VPWEAIDRMLDRWEAPTITECHRLVTFVQDGTGDAA
jgi:hypothetical protein